MGENIIIITILTSWKQLSIYLFAACDDIVDSDYIYVYIYVCVADVYTVYSLCNYLSWLADYSGWYYEKVSENPKTAKHQQVKRVRCGFGVCKSPSATR